MSDGEEISNLFEATDKGIEAGEKVSQRMLDDALKLYKERKSTTGRAQLKEESGDSDFLLVPIAES